MPVLIYCIMSVTRNIFRREVCCTKKNKEKSNTFDATSGLKKKSNLWLSWASITIPSK